MKGFIRQLTNDLINGNVKIVKFYPYTSIVNYKFITMNHNFKTEYDEYLLKLYDEINKILERYGITPDNKTAVKLEFNRISDSFWQIENGAIYVGKYDGIVSIGFSVYTEKYYAKRIRTLIY